MNFMDVILLAAGKSSRMDPISDKNLLEFCGIPLITHQVRALKKAGFEHIVVVGNQENLEGLEKALEHESDVDFVIQENTQLGMAGGVLSGSKKLKSDVVMIMSTNDVFEGQLFHDLLETAKKSACEGVIAGKKVMSYFPGGYLKLNAENFITSIIEKPGAGNEPSDTVNLVCHIYKRFSEFKELLFSSESQRDDLYEVALDNYMQKGAQMKLFKYEGYWQPIKYPWHLLPLMLHFLGQQEHFISEKATIAETAVIRGKVIIEEGVKVFDHAVIQGPCYIGANSVIANNALVRESTIGRNSVVGFSTEVARSYVHHDVWFHSNYIGDSVLDSNVSFGAGTVLGNLRFDEENIKVNVKGERMDTGLNKLGAIIGSGTRIGINSSVNPGIRIGRRVSICGVTNVDRDIPDNMFVTGHTELTMTENKLNADMRKRDAIMNSLQSL